MNYLQNIAESPKWLSELALKVNKNSNRLGSAKESGILAGAPFSLGRRHSDYVSQAGLMRRNGASSELIEATLLGMNSILPDPLPEEEIRSIARSMERYSPSRIQALNHKTFSEFLLQELERKCLYCVGDGFYFLEDNVWSRDRENLSILNHASQLTDKLLAQVDQMREQLTEEQEERLRKAVLKTQSTSFLKNSIEQFKARQEIRIDYSEMNDRKDLINLNNGAFSLKTGSLESHSADYRFTWKLEFNYDPKATCPKFDQFLNDILPPDIQRLFLQLIACALVANDREHVFVILNGETQNGKSTLVKVLQGMFDQLCANVEPSSLMIKAGNQIPSDLARLAGKRFVITSETKLGNILDAPLLKRMTGRDSLTVRHLYSSFFEFKPEFIPFVITNYLPVIDGSDTALKRRMIIIPFERIIPDEKVDKSLTGKLLGEKAGVFNRILEAWRDYEENGLVIPESVKMKTDQYVDGSNLIKRFFDECLELDNTAQMGARDLHHYYSRWSEGYKVKPLSEPQFKLIFERTTGIMQEYNSRHRFWPGVRLTKGPHL